MKQISKRKHGFRSIPLHKPKEPHSFKFLRERVSFWIAALSVIAFITGNMMGQHGWHVFWKSVLGKVDDSLIVYTGTVPPIEKVPNYEKWAAYGGDHRLHTFRQVPEDVLVPLPEYRTADQINKNRTVRGWDVYSVAHLGSYSSGEERSGSHPGVDIRTPVGTPVRSIANGIVEEVKSGGGFGNTIVIRHPNVPDPNNPRATTTLYSVYAHLSVVLVDVGSLVQKGEQIAQSGQTGYVSGPHLHFQIDRDEAPWHPYWPFSAAEARREGLTLGQAVNNGFHRERAEELTINPLLYVQANYPALITTVAAAEKTEVVRVETRRERMRRLRSERLAARLSRIKAVIASVESEPLPVIEKETIVSADETDITEDKVVVQPKNPVSSTNQVSSIDMHHDREFAGRAWEKLRITLLDGQGNTVTNPNLKRDILLVTAYGDAVFRPQSLSALDFKDGVAEVQMLPRGRRTIVIQARPFNMLSRPMRYVR